ncbi:MAG: insulinase family protein, partial [Kordiimonadaceae bacterium]|nr:insulinase family protein [Kordiimonadaceae bacterium]
FHKLCEDVTDGEVARAVAQIKAGILMSLENTTSRMEQLGRQQMIFGRHIPREETIAKIEQVDATAVMKCAARVLKGSDLSLGAIGPLDSLDEYGKIVELF